MNIRGLIACFAAGIAAFSGLSVMAAEELGPKVGEVIPVDFSTIRDRQGNLMTFSDLTGERGTAIFFVRSVDWCPFCKRQAVEVNERSVDFLERGINPIFISYDTQQKQTRFATREKFSLAILSDERSEVINAFGLLNESHAPSTRFYGIPHPVIFIVDANGTIKAKLYEEDYATNKKSFKNRPPVDVVLDKIDEVLPE